ncbi:glutamate-cysteine ligase family protein [Nocardia gipuzkoensis]
MHSYPRCGNGIEQFTVGVEEEFVLADPATGRPSLTSTAVAAAASGIDVQLELSKRQLETSTPVCTTIPALRDELGRARLLAAQATARSESRLFALSVPLRLPPTGSLTETPRYQRMAEWFGELRSESATFRPLSPKPYSWRRWSGHWSSRPWPQWTAVGSPIRSTTGSCGRRAGGQHATASRVRDST